MEDWQCLMLNDICTNIYYLDQEKNKEFFSRENLSEALEMGINSSDAEIIKTAYERSIYYEIDSDQ